MKKAALIMAGGKGERFWPRSRTDKPKQFLDIAGTGKTMLQLTVERIRPLVDMEDIYIVTNEAYRKLVREQLPEIADENILCEPVGRNTAPCIGLGAIHILKKDEDALIMVLASDHLIKHEQLFRDVLEDAAILAEQDDNIVTLGIMPNYPETGYGYIKMNMGCRKTGAYKVAQFVEKPDRETAVKYLEKGEYLWNSGMFLWKASTVLKSMKEFIPDLYDGLIKIQAAIGTEKEKEVLEKEFVSMNSVSIDYGIMEKAEDIYVIPGIFGWDDVGSWLSVERLKTPDKDGNVITGNVVTTGINNCIIEGQDRLIAVIGTENIVVIDTEDVTLIGDKTHIGEIKKILGQLRDGDMKKYL